jgi:hypothetical protein
VAVSADLEEIEASYRPCSQCGDPGHAGVNCPDNPFVPGGHGVPVADYSDGLERLRQVQDQIAADVSREYGCPVGFELTPEQADQVRAVFADEAEQREEAPVPDTVVEITADTGRLTEALRRIGESCAGLANAFSGYSETLRRSLNGVLPQLSQVEQSRREALGRMSDGRMCFHPRQSVRVDPDTTTLSCPDCGVEGAVSHGHELILAPYEFPMRPAELPSECEEVMTSIPPRYLRPEDVRRGFGFPEQPVTQDSPGLGAVGRNVPEHRPGSWLSGRPWDDRPSPARDVLPERKPDTTPEQRLREAADRIRGGWI